MGELLVRGRRRDDDIWHEDIKQGRMLVSKDSLCASDRIPLWLFAISMFIVETMFGCLVTSAGVEASRTWLAWPLVPVPC